MRYQRRGRRNSGERKVYFSTLEERAWNAGERLARMINDYNREYGITNYAHVDPPGDYYGSWDPPSRGKRVLVEMGNHGSAGQWAGSIDITPQGARWYAKVHRYYGRGTDRELGEGDTKTAASSVSALFKAYKRGLGKR